MVVGRSGGRKGRGRCYSHTTTNPAPPNHQLFFLLSLCLYLTCLIFCALDFWSGVAGRTKGSRYAIAQPTWLFICGGGGCCCWWYACRTFVCVWVGGWMRESERERVGEMCGCGCAQRLLSHHPPRLLACVFCVIIVVYNTDPPSTPSARSPGAVPRGPSSRCAGPWAGAPAACPAPSAPLCLAFIIFSQTKKVVCLISCLLLAYKCINQCACVVKSGVGREGVRRAWA